MAQGVKKILVVLALAGCALLCLSGSRVLSGEGQTTKDTARSRWRPTMELPGEGYAGAKACAECHTDEAKSYASSPMAHASAPAAGCEILSRHPRLTFREGQYSYEIARRAGQSFYTVTDGVRTISAPVLHCFGQGVAGQTYILRHEGRLYEGRVSYFQKLNGLGLTILHPRAVPASLEEAVGRPMSDEGAKGCFSCHTTGAVVNSELRLDRLDAGVSCEACHGPGEKHIQTVRAKNFKDLQIFNPGHLDAFDLTQEFCGACHMSFEKVVTMPEQGGAGNIRFQPYRIFNSRKHLINDRRLSCVACHDPHGKLEQEASFYDSKCLTCHLSTAKEVRTKRRTASACPVSRRDCVTCHMPKVELPEMHFQFTDHWIRVARRGGPVPR